MKYKLYKDVSFWSLFLLVIVIISIFCSCNPQMHIIGAGMRHHNLSQNKYQSGKHRKKVNIGRSDYSPVFIILRKR